MTALIKYKDGANRFLILMKMGAPIRFAEVTAARIGFPEVTVAEQYFQRSENRTI